VLLLEVTIWIFYTSFSRGTAIKDILESKAKALDSKWLFTKTLNGSVSGKMLLNF